MKRQYRTWHLPLLSFYSKRLYRDVAVRWKGTNLGFLCLLLAICLIPSTHHTGRTLSQLIDEHAAIYLMQIPPIEIADGRLSVDAPQPYSIIRGNRTVLLIDTTGKINTLAEAGSDALLTETHLYIRQENQTPIEYELSSLGELQLDQEGAVQLVDRLKQFILPVFYMVSLVFTYILLLLAALLCGAIARLFGAIQKRSVNYATGLRLSVVAFTPPLIVSGLLALFGRPVPSILYILLALVYLYLAVGSCRKTQSNGLYLDDEPVGA
jgi:hypothetical protein